MGYFNAKGCSLTLFANFINLKTTNIVILRIQKTEIQKCKNKNHVFCYLGRAKLKFGISFLCICFPFSSPLVFLVPMGSWLRDS